jgi:hypothetical protein
MSRTHKDKPWAVQFGIDADGYIKFENQKPKKHHPRMMRDTHAKFCGINCCGFNSEMHTARALSKRAWRLEVRGAY